MAILEKTLLYMASFFFVIWVPIWSIYKFVTLPEFSSSSYRRVVLLDVRCQGRFDDRQNLVLSIMDEGTLATYTIKVVKSCQSLDISEYIDGQIEIYPINEKLAWKVVVGGNSIGEVDKVKKNLQNGYISTAVFFWFIWVVFFIISKRAKKIGHHP